jgi:hypothetical protein
MLLEAKRRMAVSSGKHLITWISGKWGALRLYI